MSLKTLVGQMILNDVIKPLKTEGEWRILVVDNLGMKVISTCCKMRDIVMEGITMVEDLKKRRQPLTMEAVYLICPTEDSVSALINDFKEPNNPRYTAAHVFFIESCPEQIFSRIAKSQTLGRKIRTLQEVNIAYLPTEMQVFSLDNQDALAHLHSNPSITRDKRQPCIDKMAEQLATLCVSLGEYPSVRYRAASELSVEIAKALVERLDHYKADDVKQVMGDGPNKQQTQLLILDRGFDLVSPLLHELTYQAMAYDLVSIQNDVYKYEVQSGGEYVPKEALLDESDEIWVALRHKHIANVSKEITKMIKEFSDSKNIVNSSAKEATTIKELSAMLKKMPQYQKELSKHSLHLNLCEECLRIYNTDHIEKLCAVEQDLATGIDKEGEKISKDHMRAIVPLLLDPNITENNKLRIILLYGIMKQGISDENMQKFMEHAKISSQGRSTIKNISNLDVQIIQEAGKKKATLPPRKERTEETYQLSRYVPYVKDIMEDIIEGKLEKSLFPFERERQSGGVMGNGAASARSARMYGNWHKDKTQADSKSQATRLIIFIAGGVSFSEMRCAYEVTRASKNVNPNKQAWEVLIGGTEILTPDSFLQKILTLG